MTASSEEIHAAIRRLVASVPGLVIGSEDGAGVSLGHLPFGGTLDDGLMVVSSRLAAHYRALEAGRGVACLLMEDAADCRQIYARRRLLLQCRPEHIAGADARVQPDHLRTETAWLESRIDTVQAGLPPLTHFILPGGSAAGAALHWSRTICRRAETEVVAHFLLEAQEAAAGGTPPGSADEAAATPGWSGTESPACLPGRVALLTWLNRLSDVLFVFARHSSIGAGVTEIVWSPEAPGKEGTEG